jgi:DNA replication protein DnaC
MTQEAQPMLTTPTLDKLADLNLPGMVRALQEQMEGAEYQALTFDERLGLLVDREAQDRSNRRLERNLKSAKLRHVACIEDLDFRLPRGLERGLILALADASWVNGHQNLLVTGPTGVGKTFVACALAQAAVRNGYTAQYQRAPRLLDDLSIAHGDGRWARVMAALVRVDVLLIDDLAIRPLSADQASDLLEVIEDRALRRATIVTSQLPVAEWHPSLGEPTVADAILDRLTHNARRIEMRGDSLRRKEPESPPPSRETPSRGKATS